VTTGADEEPRAFRRGGISYLRIPADDPLRSATFYEAVFGWTVDTDREEPSFEDGTVHVIGHFRAGFSVAGEKGLASLSMQTKPQLEGPPPHPPRSRSA
jgi:hypothetical protein